MRVSKAAVGVEGNHRALLSRGFIGQQTPVFDRSAKLTEIAPFGKAAVTVLLGLGIRPVTVPAWPKENHERNELRGFHEKPVCDYRTSSVFFPTMSMTEVKEATERLSPHDRWELYRWLGESRDVQNFRLEELRREIAIGIEQADRGETAPLDVQQIKDEVRRRLAA